MTKEAEIMSDAKKDAPKSISLSMLKENETELLELIAGKQGKDKELLNIETQLFQAESNYLEESVYGNVVRGFEGYASTRIVRKQRPREHERIFSMSSVVYQKVIKIANMQDQEMNRFKADIYESQSDDEGYKPPPKRRKTSNG